MLLYKIMSETDLANSELNGNWEFVDWLSSKSVFPTRIIKCKTQGLFSSSNNTYGIYRIQRKYWIIGWVNIGQFSGLNVSG